MELTSNIQRLIFKFSFGVLAFSVLLWFSIFSYGLLYYLYIPAIAHVKPVHLIYDVTCMKGQRCKNPYANISLTEKNNYELLTRGQIYAIELVLDMPESERNLKQGMFMVQLDMLSENGQIVQSSRRPAILHYRSPLFKVIYTLFFMPALLAGTTEEKQTLTVPLFERYIEYQPTHHVFIEIQANIAEIYSSTLNIHAHFTGLRYMMYYWPVLSMIVGVCSNFFFVSTIIVFIWIRQIMNSNPYVNLPQLNVREQTAVEEIRKAMQERKLESGRATAAGIQRRPPPSPPDPYEIETITPYEDENSSNEDVLSLDVDDPFPSSEPLSTGDTSGIRKRATVPE